MKRLFGRQGRRAPAALPQLMGNLINRGAVELVANVYEHKYDAVDGFAADDSGARRRARRAARAVRGARAQGDRGARAALRRLLRPRRHAGRRFNQLGKFIDVVPPPSDAPSTPRGRQSDLSSAARRARSRNSRTSSRCREICTSWWNTARTIPSSSTTKVMRCGNLDERPEHAERLADALVLVADERERRACCSTAKRHCASNLSALMPMISAPSSRMRS